MSDQVNKADLLLMNVALSYLIELPGQDRSLLVEMAQEMTGDLIEHGSLREMLEYVKRYCSVVDGPDQARLVVLGIRELLERGPDDAPEPGPPEW